MIAALVDTLDWVEELREDMRENLIGRRPRPFFDWAKCGTPAQYQQHLRLDIPPCGSCKQAEGLRNWQYRIANGEKVREAARRWYAENSDAINRRRRDRRAGR